MYDNANKIADSANLFSCVFTILELVKRVRQSSHYGLPGRVENKEVVAMTKKPVLVIMAAGMGSRYGGLKQIDPVDPYGNKIIDFSICLLYTSDHGDIDALFQGFDAGPAARSLLSRTVENMIDDIPVSHVVGFEENVGGDSDEIAVQFSLVPGTVDVRQFPVGEAAGVLEQEE